MNICCLKLEGRIIIKEKKSRLLKASHLIFNFPNVHPLFNLLGLSHFLGFIHCPTFFKLSSCPTSPSFIPFFISLDCPTSQCSSNVPSFLDCPINICSFIHCLTTLDGPTSTRSSIVLIFLQPPSNSCNCPTSLNLSLLGILFDFLKFSPLLV